MPLLLDIGNSRIKWQESGRFSDSPIAFSYNREEELALKLDTNLGQCDVPNEDVIIVSVAGNEVNRQIESWIMARWNVGARFLHSEPKWKMLQNGYSNAATLGADRWYALIGAVSCFSAPMLVCDIGSAVTIDIINQNGAHLGGYITPGINMMIRSLDSGTNIAIGSSQIELDVGSIPNNTYDAIREGCLLSVVSHIEAINEKSKRKNSVILTGGDAEIISNRLACRSVTDRNLIFHGIKRVIEAL